MNTSLLAAVFSERGRAVFLASKRMRGWVVAALVCGAGIGDVAALPLAEPVSRAMTSLEGRQVELTIDGVTEQTIEGTRIPGGERVSLPIARLTADDRAFAAELRARAEGPQRFARSTWVDALVADLWVLDSAGGEAAGLAASEPSQWAGCGYFMVIVAGCLDGGRPLDFPKKMSAQRRAGLGIVVLYSAGGEVDVVMQAEAAGAPAGFLRAERVHAARRVLLDLEREMSARTRMKAGDPPVYRTAEFGRTSLERLPAYWPRPPLVAGIFDERDDGVPQAYLLRRDGTPAMCDGRVVAGRVGEVVQILEKSHARLH